jgi:putative transposase
MQRRGIEAPGRPRPIHLIHIEPGDRPASGNPLVLRLKRGVRHLSDNNTPVNIGPLARVVIHPNREMRVSSGSPQDANGYVLVDVNVKAPLHESFSHATIRAMIRAGAMRVDHGWYDEGRSAARLFAGVDSLAQCLPSERKQIARRETYVREFLRREANDATVTRTDARIKDVLIDIQGSLVNPATRCDKPTLSFAAPSARTFRRWLSTFEKHGFETIALRPRRRFCGNTISNMHPEAVRLLKKHAIEYCDERRPSVSTVHRHLAAAIKNLNAERLLRGADPVTCPAKATLSDQIKKLNAFEVYASRYGLPAARAKFAINSGGLDVDRPMQHVQIDDWSVQLHMLVDDLGVGDLFSENDRLKLKKIRLKCCAVKDIATRCILGLRLSTKSDTENSIATLALMVSDDKTDIAKAAGCLSDWPMGGPAGVISADAGGQFIDEDFRSRVADLKITYENAPAGLSHLRGHIERVFGTMHTTLIEEFPGRSFSHIVEKGDYKAEDRAALFIKSAPAIFVRWVVDWYHHSPHAGLAGETPYRAWERLTAKYGIDACPNPHQRREIFGVELERTLDANGVKVCGLFYQSPVIQEWRRRVGDARVRVRFDECDIGHVSVWIENTWITVPSVKEFVRGLHLHTWMESVRDLRRRFASQARIDEHIVAEAIQAIRRMSNEAMARVAIDRTRPTKHEIELTESSLLLGFQIVDAPIEGTGIGGGILANEIPVASAKPPQIPPTKPRPPKNEDDDDHGLED